jgi:hypothetical protein
VLAYLVLQNLQCCHQVEAAPVELRPQVGCRSCTQLTKPLVGCDAWDQLEAVYGAACIHLVIQHGDDADTPSSRDTCMGLSLHSSNDKQQGRAKLRRMLWHAGLWENQSSLAAAKGL